MSVIANLFHSLWFCLGYPLPCNMLRPSLALKIILHVKLIRWTVYLNTKALKHLTYYTCIVISGASKWCKISNNISKHRSHNLHNTIPFISKLYTPENYHWLINAQYPQVNAQHIIKVDKALGENRPPWPRQISIPILPQSRSIRFVAVFNWQYALMNVGPRWKANTKASGSLPATQSGQARLSDMKCIFMIWRIMSPNPSRAELGVHCNSVLSPIWIKNTTVKVFVAHVLIYEDPDCHQNLFSSSLYDPKRPHKITLQSAHDFLSNVAHRQTGKQTNDTENKASFDKEVIIQ